MSKSIFTLITLFSMGGALLAQDVIRNPKRPSARDAGRVITLIPEVTIIETGSDFYFKAPRNPFLTPDGSIFVQDQDQMMEFDRTGKFIRNFFKKGQGPGESQGIAHYLVADGRLYLQDMYGGKIVVFDRAGKVIREIRPAESPRSPKLLALRDGRFHLSTFQILPGNGGMALEQSLATLSEDGAKMEYLISFPVEGAGQQTGGLSAAVVTTSLIAAPFRDKWMLASHTPEYLIKVVDLESRKVVRSFARDYDRVPNTDPSRANIKMSGQGTLAPPPQKFKNDISGLFVRGEEIWVVTSTTEADKGTQIDVFDIDGRFKDSFFLKYSLNGRPSAFKSYETHLTNEAIVFVVKGEDELFSLVKCPLPKSGPPYPQK
jgi:hypothetical protein